MLKKKVMELQSMKCSKTYHFSTSWCPNCKNEDLIIKNSIIKCLECKFELKIEYLNNNLLEIEEYRKN